MVTEKNFADLVDDLFPDENRASPCGKYRDITEASKLFELAKKMALEFGRWTAREGYVATVVGDAVIYEARNNPLDAYAPTRLLELYLKSE